jgi:hypothetical protein
MGLIGRSFVMALPDAVGTMLYILGISNLSIGFTLLPGACVVGATLTLIFFVRPLPPYLDRLEESLPPS